MRYLLAGPDDFSLKSKLSQIKTSLGDQSMLSSATNFFEGSKLSPDELRLVVNATPFLSPARLVIINGLLNRFQIADKKTGIKNKKVKTAEKGKNNPDTIEEFGKIINSMPPTTVLVFTESSLNRSNPLLKLITEPIEIFEFPSLDKPQLKEWLKRRAAEAGGDFTPPAVNLLAQYIGSDLWTGAAEVEKLTLYADGRPVTEEDVKLMVSNAQEANIFHLVDAIFEQKIKKATESLENLKMNGASAAYIIAMIARQLRFIIQLKDLKSRGEKDAEIRKKLGLNSDFVWRKTLNQASFFPLNRFKDIYRRLLDTDISIKTGQMDETTAIDLLIAELSVDRATS